MTQRNSCITSKRNALLCKTKKQQDFLDRALRINQEEKRPFTLQDFPDYSAVNFRQMKLKLKDKIVLLFRSPMGHYKVKGASVRNDVKCVTNERMEVGMNMLPILRMLREQPPAIHNLKFKFDSKALHEALKTRYPANPKNQGIVLTHTLQEYIFAKMSVYPNTVHVDLGCSAKPIVYDISGVIDLLVHLGRLYQYLWNMVGENIDFLAPQKWIVTQYHFGKDGREELSGPRFERTFEDVLGGTIRFYSKLMPDRKVKLRAEKIVTLQRVLDDEISQMITQEAQQ